MGQRGFLGQRDDRLVVLESLCELCLFNNGASTPATVRAAQSTNKGALIHWVRVCDAHHDGWWDGADWGPIDALPIEDKDSIYRLPRRRIGRDPS